MDRKMYGLNKCRRISNNFFFFSRIHSSYIILDHASEIMAIILFSIIFEIDRKDNDVGFC